MNINLNAMTAADLETLETIALNLADYARYTREASEARARGRVIAADAAQEKATRAYNRLPASVK